jgi:hypothetical protein
MPNWCSNSITVRGSQQREIQRLVDAFKEGKFLNAVIPVPEDLLRDGSASHGGPNADLYDQIRSENRERHGYESWYDFCTSRWGTKWDVGEEGCVTMDEDGLGISASFDSAWAPPIGAYEALVEQGFEVVAYYYEPGMCFAGVYDNGSDDCYGDWGDSQGAKDTLPQALDEMFAISESQAEYEEEERMQDDLYRWTKEGGEKLELVQS